MRFEEYKHAAVSFSGLPQIHVVTLVLLRLVPQIDDGLRCGRRHKRRFNARNIQGIRQTADGIGCLCSACTVDGLETGTK